MFYTISSGMNEIEYTAIDKDILTVGIIRSDELASIGESFGFSYDTIESSQKANSTFRTGVDVRDDYTFAELRIVNSKGLEDYISLYIKKNFLLVVDIVDEDGSTVNCFINSIKKSMHHKVSEAKILCHFIDALIADGNMIAEEIRNSLTEMEESIVQDNADKEFNIELLNIKKRILKYYNYYGQIMDITEMLEENENEILDEDNLMYLANLTNKVSRRRDDMNLLSSIADHIQDAYAALLDQKMNTKMSIFTIITTIFFPLTIIVGWYGMNFANMPELEWRYGYLYVILLSIFTIIGLVVICKKKKWF